jgi:hypothetical protein
LPIAVRAFFPFLQSGNLSNTLGFTTHPGQGVQIFVKTLTGKTMILVVEYRQSVLALKYQIEKMEGIPPDKQRISYAGCQLEDDCTLFGWIFLSPLASC